ncbi:MAG: HD domain-containing protein [Lachnospiraceae bacterium]|nr:HD domain-containing protein [Lachnospiraceae bacterium]MCR5476085.1 HD domain-containing protein [Lachnospiraceae bacterium]
MKYIKDFREGEHIREIYLCRNVTNAVTKNGKDYQTVSLMDRTGSIDGKIWDPSDPGIDEFSRFDYIEVTGDVVLFNNVLQLNTKRVRVAREGEYDPAEYLPMSPRDNGEMYEALKGLIETVKDPHYHRLLEMLFIEDAELVRQFRTSSAAKSVHHGYVGGLLEHTLSVAKLCEYLSGAYPFLNHDLLLTAAICHDIAKTKEFTPFPENDYTDEGQLLGHIVMGSQMVAETAAKIEGFPPVLLSQLQHCILAHHGKYEFGSPKLPALAEALALNFADDTDAKMEIFKELLENNSQNKGWLGFNRLLDSNVRATRTE